MPIPGNSWTERLCSGWRLPLRARASVVDASPRRRARRPDRHRRLRELRIVERSDPSEDQVRSRFGLAEQWSAAARAEPPVHPIAAVRDARVVARRPRHREGRHAKARTHRSAARAQVLAIAAPAHPRGDRRFRALPTNRAAKAAPCHGHVALQASVVVLRKSYSRTAVGRLGIRAEARGIG